MLAVLLMLVAPERAFFLVIESTAGGVTTAEYPSANRCERARKAVEVEFHKRAAEAEKNAAASGGVVGGYGPMPRAFCIPA